MTKDGPSATLKKSDLLIIVSQDKTHLSLRKINKQLKKMMLSISSATCHSRDSYTSLMDFKRVQFHMVNALMKTGFHLPVLQFKKESKSIQPVKSDLIFLQSLETKFNRPRRNYLNCN